MRKTYGLTAQISIKEREYFTPNDAMLCFGIALGVFIVAQGLCLALGNVLAATLLQALGETFAMRFAIIGGTLSILLTVVVYCKVRHIKFFNATALSERFSFAQLMSILLAVVGLIFFSMPIVNAVTKGLVIEDGGVNLPLRGDWSDIVFLLVAVCLLPGLCEELLMRGVIATGLSRLGIVISSLLSGAIFMLFHMNPLQTVHQFLLGCMLAFTVLRGGSLWLSILAHFFNNLLAVGLGFLLSESTQILIFDTLWYISMPFGLVLIVVGICLFVRETPFPKYSKGYELTMTEKHLEGMPLPKTPQLAVVRADKRRAEQSSGAVVGTNAEQGEPTIQAEKLSILPVLVFVAGLLVCMAMWAVSLSELLPKA